MSKFLTGKKLEDKLTDIIWDAKKYVVLVSPYIKLDDHVRSIFDKLKSTHEIHIILIFGKNEGYKQKSFNSDDFGYFKEFKHISILYNKDLHAKHYSNERESLITSLNLYDYSMINNIEYGVHFTKNLNPADNLFEETEDFTYNLVYENSEAVFVRRPQYKKKLLGLTKSFQNSKIIYDISNDFFKGVNYEVKYLNDFDFDELTDIDKVFDKKPQRKERVNKEESIQEIGYCIRTGEEIPFDPERPMCHSAWRTWNRYGDYDFSESYCHKSGKKSNGKTSMGKPIL